MGIALPPAEVEAPILKCALQAFHSDVGSSSSSRSVDEAISAVDQRDSGYLDASEMSQVMALLGMVMTRPDTGAAMQEIDADRDGLVSRAELSAWWAQKKPPPKPVFTVAEERDRRESFLSLEQQHAEREKVLQKCLTDAERHAKVEVARHAEQERRLRADFEQQLEQTKQSSADPKELAEAQRGCQQAQQELSSTPRAGRR
jgi:Ca2+-binding EF-hand superfamily protein